jgi:asparagine synthase (glutamine-hydrolysing)
MCGICGSTGLTRESVRRANAALIHRGPDDDGFFCDVTAGVSLAARRLSIIDVPGGHQPIRNEDGNVTVVFNGEIYNFQRLREHLLGNGHTLSTETDTEVLVHLYEDYRAELVHALEGMYAFALWDSKDELLLLARDRFGEKPLFYTEKDGELSFASELHALVAGGACEWNLDPEALDDYFTFGYVAAPTSVVRGVKQLPPGHTLTWRRGSPAEIRRYWAPPAHAASQTASFGELVDEAEELLVASVRTRLVADVPVGVFLSGGVDSTLLAALAARETRSLKTFTVTYDRGAVGEGSAARRSAELICSDHHELVLTEADVRDAVQGHLDRLDQPIADEAFVALRAISGFARRDVKVAVGGEGADEVFAGYPRYRWLARSAMLERRAPARALRGAARLANALPGRARRLEHVFSTEPLGDRHVAWVTGGRRGLRARLYGPRLLPHAAREPASGRPSAGPNGSVESLLMRLDQEHWLPGDVLAKADRASMQASLELRTPYLQRELVEFAATISPTVHARDGGKMILRRLLERLLPQAAHERRKVAFRTPTADWLRRPLAAAVQEQLAGSRLYEDGWFDRGNVKRLVDEHLEGTKDRANVVWPLFVLGVWLDAR